MKVCAFPNTIPVPKLTLPIDMVRYKQEEDAAMAACKAYLLAIGYTGPNTGKEYSIPHADGAARYMVGEGPAGTRIEDLPHDLGNAKRDNARLEATICDLRDKLAKIRAALDGV
jgi:hypothetical protein